MCLRKIMELKGRPETGKMNILRSPVSGLRYQVQVLRFRRQTRDLNPNPNCRT